MANLRDIRRRISSVASTQQITRAMKMVAAAKLRRAQETILASRPYSIRMMDMLRSLALRADPTAHPLLEVREEKKADLVVITADKGLCGGFNANAIKRAIQFLEDKDGVDISLICVGRKSRDFFKRRELPITTEFIDVFRTLDYDVAKRIAKTVIDRYTAGESDRVYLLYNRFKSVIAQETVVDNLIPVPPLDITEEEVVVDFIYEPSAKTLIEDLLPRNVEIQVYTALLESQASEFGARMTAMDSATNNAADMIGRLTLHYNRARQAAITTEIIEIVSGAEALRRK